MSEDVEMVEMFWIQPIDTTIGSEITVYGCKAVPNSDGYYTVEVPENTVDAHKSRKGERLLDAEEYEDFLATVTDLPVEEDDSDDNE